MQNCTESGNTHHQAASPPLRVGRFAPRWSCRDLRIALLQSPLKWMSRCLQSWVAVTSLCFRPCSGSSWQLFLCCRAVGLILHQNFIILVSKSYRRWLAPVCGRNKELEKNVQLFFFLPPYCSRSVDILVSVYVGCVSSLGKADG